MVGARRPLGAGGQPGGVAGSRRLGSAAPGEALGGVEAKGFQQAVAGRLGADGRLRHNQRAVDQPGEKVEDRHGPGLPVGTDRFGGLQREPAGEDRQLLEAAALRLRQEVIAPVDGGAQRPVARRPAPVAAGQQAQPVVETGGELAGGQDPHPGGGEFDRQRNAVQVAADLRHRGSLLDRQDEVGSCCLGAGDEQLDGRRPGETFPVGRLAGGRESE